MGLQALFELWDSNCAGFFFLTAPGNEIERGRDELASGGEAADDFRQTNMLKHMPRAQHNITTCKLETECLLNTLQVFVLWS
jgi:hypothetical protein